MARKPRVNQPGFYHVCNRGVERRDVYLDDKDRIRFLEIIDESAVQYDFAIHSYCLMKNHYHLLLETRDQNLSLVMKQINSKYGIFFNRKYDRVGHLWQGRFKSWFVFNKLYLGSLIEYIELNPVQAGITDKLGDYRWSMSSHLEKMNCADFGLINEIGFDSGMTEKAQNNVDAVFNAPHEVEDGHMIHKKRLPLSEFFDKVDRKLAISRAIKVGFTQVEIGRYLGISNVAISRIYSNYRARVQLFSKLKGRGVFWSYSKTIEYDQAGHGLFVEYLLKYGDFDEISLGFELFGKRVMKSIWQARVANNHQFLKLNVMLARVFFNMDVDGDYFSKVKNERLEKLRLLAS